MKTQVYFSKKAYDKIMYWVDKCPMEISGLGMVQIVDNKPFITDVILLEQEVSGASTDLDPAAVNKAMYETRDLPGDLKFWWHSHVNMGVFWSGTDKETISNLGQHGYFISTVFNKKKEMKTALYTKEPFELFFDDVPNIVMEQGLANKELDEEYDKKVKTKTYVSDRRSLQYDVKTGKASDEEGPFPWQSWQSRDKETDKPITTHGEKVAALLKEEKVYQQQMLIDDLRASGVPNSEIEEAMKSYDDWEGYSGYTGL